MTSMVSTAPAVQDYLVALAQRVLPDVQVTDGQPLAAQRDFLAVGFTGEPGDAVIEAVRSKDQATLDPDHEAYEVACYAYSLSGDTDLKARRARVYGIADVLAAELTVDPTLGGLVGRAHLTTEAFMQQQTQSGAEASLRFVISVDAWTL